MRSSLLKHQSVGLPRGRPAGLNSTHHAPRPQRLASMRIVAAAGITNPRAARLRQLLRGQEIVVGPCCHDGLSARLIERAGFPFAFMSGFSTSAAKLGAPDTGLISYAEMVEVGRNCHEATRAIPIIGDGDTGYGNAMNVKRTVRGYAQAGFAGILIEDQVSPKSCGHMRNKRVVGREEAVARIRAAVDAREEGSDIVIVARTDARQAVSLEEALWRVQAFAEAGADVLFIDALESEAEMRAFTNLGGAATTRPKMANNLEGGGKTPVLSPARLEDMGFRLVAYPLSLLGVSIHAMEMALEGLKRGQAPPASALGSFPQIQASVGFPEYYAEEAKYAISSPGPSSFAPSAPGGDGLHSAVSGGPSWPSLNGASAPTASSGPSTGKPSSWSSSYVPPPPKSFGTEGDVGTGTGAGPPSGGGVYSSSVRQRDVIKPQVVEADVVMEDNRSSARSSASSAPSGASQSSSTSSSSASSTGGSSWSSGYTPPPPRGSPSYPQASPTSQPNYTDKSVASGAAGEGVNETSPVRTQQEQDSYKRSRSFRVKISDRNTGLVKLETRIPAGFLSGIKALIPQQVQGFNIEKLLEDALGAKLPEAGQPLLSLPSGSADLIQIYLD